MLKINTKRKTQVVNITLKAISNWQLKIYIIQKDPDEVIDLHEVEQLINDKLTCLEKEHMSKEFEYFRIGVVFLHFGMRGIDLSIWHFGKWGSTIELFNCSWYCYGRDYSSFEVLDNAEPLLCQYEIKYLIDELSAIINTIEAISMPNDFEDQYISKYLCSENNIK